MFTKFIASRTAAFTVAAGLAAALTPAAQAQEAWKTVGDWNIVVEENAGNGCLMEKTFDNGILLQFGLLPLRDGGFFAAYSEDWTFIEEGAKAPVSFLFEGVEFNGESEGYIDGPWYGGFVFTNNVALVYEFAKKTQMTVTAGDNPPVTLSLDGTLKGVEELINCQAAQG
ncbi:hypothetical protein [Marinibacterium profundimaris]|uniref:Uncharacterized protein n=1 Tax=Marinibacterium profundimaris TaxID=1679460 RepID=A0A225NSQ4_9RHOB|nr:hypothetical protein [Marinibacterium profundimaris]OWU74640.1 hypothetical protein ATO3_08375 [Marinibacterium profundimaris]